MHLLSRAALCCLAVIPLAACASDGSFDANRALVIGTGAVNATVTPQPTPKPQKPRKTCRPSKKD